MDLFSYGYNEEMSYISNDHICNFPFETEDDSSFRPGLVLKAVHESASRTDILKSFPASLIFIGDLFCDSSFGSRVNHELK